MNMIVNLMGGERTQIEFECECEQKVGLSPMCVIYIS